MRSVTGRPWPEEIKCTVHMPPSFPLILAMCRQLDVCGIVDRACPMRANGSIRVTHGQVMEFLLVHVAQHPGREPLYQLSQWAEEHSVSCLWDCSPDAFNDDRVGKALDMMAAAAREIHAALVKAVLKQYPLDTQWLHWDHSYVAFTDARRETELVGAGYGDGQVRERQVKLGLHVTSDDGVPVHYELLPGGAQQQPRAKPLVAQLQETLQREQLGIVTDRGGIGYDIVASYLASGTHFISALQWTAVERQLVARVPLADFTEAAYRSVNKPDDAYYVYSTRLSFRRQKHSTPLDVQALIVHSMGKQARDARSREALIARTVDKLELLRSRLNVRRFRQAEYVRPLIPKKIPRPLAKIMQYELTGPDGDLQLRYWVDDTAKAEDAKLDGRYILVHNLPDNYQPEEALKIHKRQFLVENRFRNFRSGLAINPVWLHRDSRIQGLVLVYIVALTLLALLGLTAKRVKLDTEYYHRMTPFVMLRRFSHLQVVVVMARGQPAHLHVELNPDQAEIIHELNLPHPDTLLLPDFTA